MVLFESLQFPEPYRVFSLTSIQNLRFGLYAPREKLQNERRTRLETREQLKLPLGQEVGRPQCAS